MVMRYCAIKWMQNNFQVIEFGGANQIDVSGATGLRFDAWFSEEVDMNTSFLFRVVDFSTGSAVEGDITINENSTPAMVQGQWLTYDFTLAELATLGLTTNTAIQQLVIDVANTPEVYLDNIYFYSEAIEEGTDARLSDLQIDGTTINGFSPNVFSYSAELPTGTTTVPSVTFATNDANATATITDATELPGTTSVLVTAADGTTTQTYEIAFIIATPVAVPTVAAADPTEAAANVVSVYSDSYTDITIEGFNLYGGAAFEQVDLSGNEVLRYAVDANNFQVIEFGGANQIDVSGATGLRFDAWFSEEVDMNTSFLFRVVDFSTGSAVEGDITINENSTPAMVQGQWLTYDFTLAELATLGLTTNTAIQQLVIDVANTPEVYLDNIYFYSEAIEEGTDARLSDLQIDGTTINGFSPNVFNYSAELPTGTTTVPTVTFTTNDANAAATITDATELPGTTSVVVTSADGTTTQTYEIAFTVATPVAVPTVAAADPTEAAANVVSVYSDTYTDITIEGFNLYGGAAFEQVDLSGNEVLRYKVDANNFQVIEFGGANQIDVSSMTGFRFDAWFSEEVTATSSFLMKVVDLGTGSAIEASVTLDQNSSPAMVQGQWLTYDFSLAELSNLGLTMNTAIQQLVVDVVNTPEVYLDNIYFYSEVIEEGEDARLSDLQVDGTTVDGFSANILDLYRRISRRYYYGAYSYCDD